MRSLTAIKTSKKFPPRDVEKNSLYSFNSNQSIFDDFCAKKSAPKFNCEFDSDARQLLNKTYVADTHRFSANQLPENAFRSFNHRPHASRNSYVGLYDKFKGTCCSLNDGLDHNSKKTLKHISKDLTKSLRKFRKKMIQQIHENLKNYSDAPLGPPLHVTYSESSGKSHNTIGSSFSKKVKKRKSLEKYDLKKKIKHLFKDLNPSPSLVIKEVIEQTMPSRNDLNSSAATDVNLTANSSMRKSRVTSMEKPVADSFQETIKVTGKSNNGRRSKTSSITDHHKLFPGTGTTSQKSQTVQTQSLRSKKSQTSFNSLLSFTMDTKKQPLSVDTCPFDQKNQEICLMQEQFRCMNYYPEYTYPCFYFCNGPQKQKSKRKEKSRRLPSISTSSTLSSRSGYKYGSKYDSKYGTKYDVQYLPEYDSKYDLKYSSRYKPTYDPKYESESKYGSKYDDKYGSKYDSKYDSQYQGNSYSKDSVYSKSYDAYD